MMKEQNIWKHTDWHTMHAQHLKTMKVLFEEIETMIKRQSMNKNPCPIQRV